MVIDLHRKGGLIHRYMPAVLVDDHFLGLGHNLPQIRNRASVFVSRTDYIMAHTPEYLFFRIMSHHGKGRFVYPLNDLSFPDNHQADGKIGDDFFRGLKRLFQFFLDQQVPGDILVNPSIPEQLPSIVNNGHAVGPKANPAAVFFQGPVLQVNDRLLPGQDAKKKLFVFHTPPVPA